MSSFIETEFAETHKQNFIIRENWIVSNSVFESSGS